VCCVVAFNCLPVNISSRCVTFSFIPFWFAGGFVNIANSDSAVCCAVRQFWSEHQTNVCCKLQLNIRNFREQAVPAFCYNLCYIPSNKVFNTHFCIYVSCFVCPKQCLWLYITERCNTVILCRRISSCVLSLFDIWCDLFSSIWLHSDVGFVNKIWQCTKAVGLGCIHKYCS
jgi:hypothetical protein